MSPESLSDQQERIKDLIQAWKMSHKNLDIATAALQITSITETENGWTVSATLNGKNHTFTVDNMGKVTMLNI